jgi:23S rRNA pseudouridine2604 synthase
MTALLAPVSSEHRRNGGEHIFDASPAIAYAFNAMEGTRINKYLAEHGYCSRREADRLVEQGRVFINDVPAKMGDRVASGDQVRVHGRDKVEKPKPVYILYHKPVGIICTTDRKKKDNIMDAVQVTERVFPVGRLDVESSGLILMTNDGVLANRIMHPRYEHEKEYVVDVDKKLRAIDIGKWQSGIRLEDGMTQPTRVRQMGPRRFAIILKEGRNRQVRRMAEELGYKVTALKRTRIGDLKLGTFPVGQWRALTEGEVSDLQKATAPPKHRHGKPPK